MRSAAADWDGRNNLCAVFICRYSRIGKLMFDNLSVFIVNSFVAHGEKEFGPPGKMAVNMESVSIFF